MEVDALFDLISKKGRIANPKNSGLSVLVDKRYRVGIERSPHKNTEIHLFSTVGKLPSDNKNLVLEKLLSSHLMGYRTNNASFGLHPDKEHILLFKTIDIYWAHFEDIEKQLIEFVEMLKKWTFWLNQTSTPSSINPL